MSKPLIHVAAGLIQRSDGRLLLAQRPADKPWPGWWELPGGKIEAGESILQALARELMEELGITVTDAWHWITYEHDYAERRVRLYFCKVRAWQGSPQGLEGQQLQWVDPQLPIPTQPLLPATHPPLRWLRLPEHYLLTSIGSSANLERFLAQLQATLAQTPALVQFREPEWAAHAPAPELHHALTQVLHTCRQAGALCLINSHHPRDWWPLADGVHLRAQDAASLQTRPLSPDRLLGLSAHNQTDLARAHLLQADFAVLGHVLPTPSHPGQPALGWEQFQSLACNAGLPVYAIGGQSCATLDTARRHNAHGIASLRHWLPQSHRDEAVPEP